MSEFYPHNFAVARIHRMKDTAGMWAYTTEAFVAQVRLLLEFAGLEQKNVHGWEIATCKDMDLLDRITDERAKLICESALEILP